MDTGTGKAIEALVILGLVLGFYFQQQASLRRSKSETPRTDAKETTATERVAPANKADEAP